MSIGLQPRLHIRPAAYRLPVILVVEDEPLVRTALAEHLQDEGFSVVEAENAAEARAIIDSDDSAIDLVFTDIRMPGDMDGFGLAGWVKRYHPNLPVMMCTGDAKKKEVAHYCDQSVLPKPYQLQEVVAHIRQSLDGQQSGAL